MFQKKDVSYTQTVTRSCQYLLSDLQLCCT